MFPMNEDQLSPAEAFRACAEAYVDLLDKGRTLGREDFLARALMQLSSLMERALLLPRETEEVRLLDEAGEDRQRLLATALEDYLGRTGLYWTLPATNDPVLASGTVSESEAGSLADDLAEIYGALEAGLAAAREGDMNVAVSSWAWSFWSHWGEHAAEAMRALFYVVQQSSDLGSP